jgi:ABC-type multidrug transport system fused ATPase/permease subunit
MICKFSLLSTSLMISVRVNLLNVAIVSTTLALAITTPGMTGGQAGFILGFSTKVVEELHNILYDLRNYDLDGVKLERLDEYRKLETEDIPMLYGEEKANTPELDAISRALANWPSAGNIQVTGLGARYAPDMPNILHDVSFACRGGERVGIVGATGGGKSTLAKALFRFVEVTTGKIEIDGKGMLFQS